MTRSDSSRVALFLAVALGLGGCGGARPAGTTTPGGERASQETTETERETLPLDAPHLVPGTGVTLQAPRGSEPTPFGAGFVHRARRIQMLVAGAEGSAEVLAAFRRGLENDAEVEATEEVEIAGHATTLHIDRQQAGEDQWIERVWAIVEQGDRAFVVAGAYDASRSERVRALVRASVLSAAWDPTAPLDPELAVGFRLTAPEGLEVDRSTTGSVTYGRAGAMVPPVVGSPTLFLIAVPAMVPLAQRDDACEPILFQAGPVPDDHVRSRGRIETETVEGCEVTGWQEREAGEGEEASQLATYAAVVYVGDQTFLVAGVVGEAERDAWLPRFAEAARTVSATR